MEVAMANIQLELLYDEVGKARRRMDLSLPAGSKVRDALLAIKKDGFEIGYMSVSLNMENLNDPKKGLEVTIPDRAVLHIRLIHRWEVD